MRRASLLIALAAAALAVPACGGWGRDEAMAEIKKRGGRVEGANDGPEGPVGMVYLNGPRFTDRDLSLLRALPDLRGLHLRNAGVSDRGLRLVGEMSQLESLYLWDTAITDGGWPTSRA